MDIKLHNIKIRDLVDGYQDNGEKGVVAYGGKLDVRPPYQREFIYKEKERNAVIDTVLRNLPLNVMYWACRDDGTYEVMDGQQRTISLCQYFDNVFSIKTRMFHNLEDTEQNRFLDYELMIYICNGTYEEKREWFKVINIAGKELTEQEMRNAIFHGPFVSDAKRWFSKPSAPAAMICANYVDGSRERQDYLERAIEWISGTTGKGVDEYMAVHQKDPNANILWTYFKQVITWIEATFVHTKDRVKILKGQDWGNLYKKHGSETLDTAAMEKKIKDLLIDDDVTKKSGIIPYVLGEGEKHLSIRAFTDAMKLAAYERQKGVCPMCGNKFSFDEMQGDHIKPWCKGGKTSADNCQMLCGPCNFTKGSK